MKYIVKLILQNLVVKPKSIVSKKELKYNVMDYNLLPESSKGLKKASKNSKDSKSPSEPETLIEAIFKERLKK